MIEPGDTPPTFTATLGTSDHELFDLDGHLGDGPVVLAFFRARSARNTGSSSAS